MRHLTLTLICLFALVASENFSAQENTLAPLLNFNFAGKKNSWTNITPTVGYGWTQSIVPETAAKFIQKFYLEAGIRPYLGTTIKIDDTTSYIPALALPGNAGIEAKLYFILGDTTKFSCTLSPLAGIKVISGFTDASLSIVQHFFGGTISCKYKDLFSLAFFCTWAAHNSSDYSEDTYRKLFNNLPANIKYGGINLQTKLTSISGTAPLYLNITWRNLLTKEYDTYANRRFWTIGLTGVFNLATSSAGGITRASSKAALL